MPEPLAAGPVGQHSPPPSHRTRPLQTLLLVLGVALLVGLVAAHGAGDVLRALLEVRFRALAVIAAHLPEVVCAALGWRVLLDPATRPRLPALIQLRLVKEAVNALLPVAQVGGDVVRAKLAESPARPLSELLASVIVDAGLGLVALLMFSVLGLAAAYATADDPRLSALALQLGGGAAVVITTIVLFERLGLVRLIDAGLAKAHGSLAHLADLSVTLRELLRQRGRLAWSAAWHLGSWLCGIFETYVALWALDLHPTLDQAFILESLAQAIKAVGFAVPGALGIQEGGYILLCSTLGIPADKALALSLLRRLRELALGAVGLVIWRWMAAKAEVDTAHAPLLDSRS